MMTQLSYQTLSTPPTSTAPLESREPGTASLESDKPTEYHHNQSSYPCQNIVENFNLKSQETYATLQLMYPWPPFDGVQIVTKPKLLLVI